MMEYKVIAYIAIGALLTLYVVYRMLGQMAIKKMMRSEYENVLNKDEFKVKGKFE